MEKIISETYFEIGFCIWRIVGSFISPKKDQKIILGKSNTEEQGLFSFLTSIYNRNISPFTGVFLSVVCRTVPNM